MDAVTDQIDNPTDETTPQSERLVEQSPAEILGEVVWLMEKSKHHSSYSVANIARTIIPPGLR